MRYFAKAGCQGVFRLFHDESLCLAPPWCTGGKLCATKYRHLQYWHSPPTDSIVQPFGSLPEPKSIHHDGERGVRHEHADGRPEAVYVRAARKTWGDIDNYYNLLLGFDVGSIDF